jgi:hypothetical protein
MFIYINMSVKRKRTKSISSKSKDEGYVLTPTGNYMYENPSYINSPILIPSPPIDLESLPNLSSITMSSQNSSSNNSDDTQKRQGDKIDGLGISRKGEDRLIQAIRKQEEQARKKRRSELRKKNTSKESRERARIRSKEYRERQKKLKNNKKGKSGGKRTRKQIKKHKKSRQSKKA